MCGRGSWRSFDAKWLQDTLCAVQQCTECGEHRAMVIEDARVVGVDQEREVRQDDDVDDSETTTGW